jgi:beta-glucosidase
LYSKFVKPLEGIRNKVPASTKVLYARGSGILEPVNPDNQAYADSWDLDSGHSGASFAEAVSAAKQADVALVFVGINELLEREDEDRTYLNLPPVQLQLIQQVLAVNPKTVVVLLNGGPVSLKSLQATIDPPAVLDMFWAGEEGGNAIADVIFGNYNPGGKLPYTVYDSLQRLPPMTEYDISKGFTYMYFEGKPGYAFGHGLSYTQFDYSNLKLSSSEVPGTGQVTIQLDVRNSGKRLGDEVVQLYAHKSESKVKRPTEQLAGFERITLQPGEEKTVSFSLPVKQLSFWDSDRKSFAVEPGTADVMVGSSSDDIRLKGEFQVTTAGRWPPGELTLSASTTK